MAAISSAGLISPQLRKFLLANGGLSRISVANLLLSSSFGTNALFYAAWLGYMMGMWALAVQLFWALSFFLLSRFSAKFQEIDSLHDSIGRSFGSGAKIAASVCSLIGIGYFIGWEIAIARDIASASTPFIPSVSSGSVELFLIVSVAFALAYTLVGGIATNASVNKALNLVKVVSLISLCAIVLGSIPANFADPEVRNAMFPPIEKGLLALGAFGLTTNLFFNLSWQFVDNSTWQSIIAGAAENKEKIRNELRVSGIAIFATIGFFGTILGASARTFADVSPDAFFGPLVGATLGFEPVFAVLLLILTCACVMSLIDGMLLAATQTATVDILSTITGKAVSLMTCRLVLIIAAALSVWGVDQLITLLGGSIFDFVYVLILSQLAIIGPAVFSLSGLVARSLLMILPIILSLSVGFGMVLVGAKSEISILIDGAGSATILTSLTATAMLILALKARRAS